LIRLLQTFLLAGLPFVLARLVLPWVYRPDFVALGGKDYFWGWLQGLRFDLSSLALFLAPGLLLYHLPGPFRSKFWRAPWAVLLGLTSLFFTAVLLVDLVYFGQVHRHLAFELANLWGDWGLMFEMAKIGFLLQLLGFTAFSLFWGRMWWWFFRRPYRAMGLKGYGVMLLLLVLLGRGGVGAKPLAVIDAYKDGDPVLANLSLNGVFTSSHAVLSKRDQDHHPYEPSVALSQALPGLDPQAAYPLLRHGTGPLKGKNLVFILVESLSAHYLDALGGKAFGVTPELDRLVGESLVFDDFYASGQRSLEGLQTVLTGVPSLLGQPTIGEGFQAKVSSLGKLAQANGYQTLFIQAMKRESFRGNAIAGATGFLDYYGQEDIPNRLTYPTGATAPFGWDYETLMFSLDRFGEQKKPFVGFIVTSTTHTPFPRLEPRFEKYPYGVDSEGGFLNSLAYFDWSLGEFLKAAQKQPWFANTVFVITADHAQPHYGQKQFLDYFRIPLILYSPGYLKPGRDSTLGSQLDLLPTLVGLMGFQGDYATVGRDLAQGGSGFAWAREGELMLWITKNAVLRHSLANRVYLKGRQGLSELEAPVDPALGAAMEGQLLSLDQLSYELLQANRWAP